MGNILEASFHPKCSYAWRSILQARDVIHRGAMWKVGDGSSIAIWGQRWLPNQPNGRFISPKIASTMTWVKDLFYPGTRIWDPRLLERTFVPWEAELIKNILVSKGWSEDLLIWLLTPNGHYSVRSAYHMLFEGESRQEPGSSSSENSHQVWKSIWKIRTPNKIRHFIWCVARDSMPIKRNLKARHLPVEETCELCGDSQESFMHSIWLCEHAQSVWKSELCFVQYYRKGFRMFFVLLEEVLRKGSRFHVAWFSAIVWSLWQR